MEDRTVIEWDKDDLDALRHPEDRCPGARHADLHPQGLRADRAALRHAGSSWRPIPAEDPAVYEMLCRADSIGVFQVESRAQMTMLPRLKPREFYDLVIEVAIVRPGPIQGDMVHPYLRRRNGHRSRSTIPPTHCERCWARPWACRCSRNRRCRSPSSAPASPPDEADRLRRAMATFKRNGDIQLFRDKFIAGMVANGYDRDFADALLQPDRRVRHLRLSGKPCRELCAAGLCLGLDQMLPPRGLRLRAAQQPADGVLRPGPDRPRRARARRRGAPGRRQPQRLGLHAGAAGGSPILSSPPRKRGSRATAQTLHPGFPLSRE